MFTCEFCEFLEHVFFETPGNRGVIDRNRNRGVIDRNRNR